MTNSVRFLKSDKQKNRYYECPLCGSEVIVPASTFNGQCPACNATIIDYNPARHQLKFHESKAQYKLNIGGFASGKTTMCCAEIAVHVLSTPNGRSLITGPKLQQVRDAVIPELDKFLPKHMIAKKQMSPNVRYTMKNGHEILVYASNDEENLRSLNLTAFYIEEASNVDYEIFRQLQTRLRNEAAVVRDEYGQEIDYNFLGLVSSNPDDGWVRSEFLLISEKIFASESIDRTMYDRIRTKASIKHYHSFLSSSRDNNYLPKEFLERLMIGKHPNWIRKYIDCYLDVREGAVYPDFAKSIVQPFPIKQTWPRIGGFDKGYRDQTAMLVAAIDPKDGTIFCHYEYYHSERPISHNAAEIKKDIDGWQFYLPIKADPTIRNRNERDGDTYQTYFYKVSGIMLEAGNNDIDAGIDKVRDYMYLGKLKFFATLDNLKTEALEYVYKDKDSAGKEKPIDRNNHLMDCLRYMIAQLPDNPNDFNGTLIRQSNQIKDFWDGGWEDDDDDVLVQGQVYILKGGFNGGRSEE